MDLEDNSTTFTRQKVKLCSFFFLKFYLTTSCRPILLLNFMTEDPTVY